MSLVSLLLIDEVHLLGTERGGTLEAIVARMKLVSKCSSNSTVHLNKLRIVALSATIPNIYDLAEWLDVNPTTALKT